MKKKSKAIRLAQRILNDETDIQCEDSLTGEYLRDLQTVASNIELMGAAIRGYKTHKKIEEFTEAINDEFEEYSGQHAVNVKVWDCYVDIPDLVEKMNKNEHDGDYHLDKPITEEQAEWLEDKFRDDYDMFNFWIEMEREYMIDTIKEDHPDFNIEDAGFDGRSGGHFCLCKTFEIEYGYKHPEDVMLQILHEYTNDNDYDVLEVELWVDGALEDQEGAFKTLKEIREILIFVNKFVKGLDFSYEVAFRIGEAMENNLDEFEEWKEEQDA